MFDLLPENLYSRKAVRWGVVLSLAFIAIGAFGVIRAHYEDGMINVALGLAMLFVWSTRKRELPPNSDESASELEANG